MLVQSPSSLSGPPGTYVVPVQVPKFWKQVYGWDVLMLVKLYAVLPKKSDRGTFFRSVPQSGAL